MRNLLSILIILLSFKAASQDYNLTRRDSVTLTGRIINFEDKKSSSGFVAIYKNFEISSLERLADIEIDKSLLVSVAELDTNGDFKIKLLKGEYVIRIHTPLSSEITLQMWLKSDEINLGTYDLFSSCYYLDEPPAMTALRQRVYNRVMQYRMDGNSTQYCIVDRDQIKSSDINDKVQYSDFDSDSDILSYYTSSSMIINSNSSTNREKTKSKMEKYLSKMRKKYSKIEERYFNEAMSKETDSLN